MESGKRHGAGGACSFQCGGQGQPHRETSLCLGLGEALHLDKWGKDISGRGRASAYALSWEGAGSTSRAEGVRSQRQVTTTSTPHPWQGAGSRRALHKSLTPWKELRSVPTGEGCC